MQIYIISLLAMPFVFFFKLYLGVFSSQVYNDHCIVTDNQPITDTSETGLYLQPGIIFVQLFAFTAVPEDVGSELEVKFNCLVFHVYRSVPTEPFVISILKIR